LSSDSEQQSNRKKIKINTSTPAPRLNQTAYNDFSRDNSYEDMTEKYNNSSVLSRLS